MSWVVAACAIILCSTPIIAPILGMFMVEKEDRFLALVLTSLIGMAPAFMGALILLVNTPILY